MNKNVKKLLVRLKNNKSFSDLPEVFRRMGRYLKQVKNHPELKNYLLEFLTTNEITPNHSHVLILLSDWHIGNKGWGNMPNFYKTVQKLEDNLIRVLRKYQMVFPFEAVSVIILGDMLEYVMRSEHILGIWNDIDITEKVNLTVEYIDDILNSVYRVTSIRPDIYYLYGNHGRVTEKSLMIFQDTIEHLVALKLSEKWIVKTPNSEEYIPLKIYGRTIILEHGHNKYGTSLGRPTINSIKRRFLYFDDVEENVDAIIIGHYHAKMILDLNERVFVVAPSLIPKTEYSVRKGFKLLPKQLVIIANRNENGRLKLSPCIDIWGI